MAEKKKKTQNNSEKKIVRISKKKLIVSIAVVVIIALLIIFWRDIFPKKEEPQKDSLDAIYNGYAFYQVPPLNMWSVSVNTPNGVTPVEFYYHPQELELLPYNTNITKAIAVLIPIKGRVLIAYDTQLATEGIAAVAGSEIAKITGKIFRIETKSGFIGDVGDAQVPVYNCSIARPTQVVIELRISTNNSIEYRDNCIIINSITREDLVKNSDYLVYKLLGIIPGPAKGNQTQSSQNQTNAVNTSVNATANASQ